MDKPEKIFENLITMEEVLVLFKNRYQRRTIYDWVNKRNMPHRKFGKRLYFDKNEVILWFQRRTN